ncbi:LysR family transcriptional regulator [Actinomadura litoris]|uniref:LysR family transcriptional regulator n=1 Tax=Actinomadura litoris TaxID=2678616 RepID=UPI001FA6EEAA|nr:LysR family transcriptional regulator [Actinomadura litoris]
MDVVLLRGFLAIAKHGHYGRAAHELSMTQPTLTKQIQSLESRVGGRLFERGRHGARLTALGAVLLPEAQDLVRRADALADRIDRMARGEAGRLSVGFGLSSIELAPRAVAAFRRRHPDVDVTLDDMSSQVQLDRLAAGELDVGFVRLPIARTWGHVPLATDRLALAASGPHEPPPGSAADVARWADRHRFIQLARSKGPGLSGQIDRLCAALDTRPHVIQEAHDLQTVLALVAAGVGTAFVPASAGRIAPPAVTITPIDHPAAEWQIGAAWNPRRATAMTTDFLALAQSS